MTEQEQAALPSADLAKAAELSDSAQPTNPAQLAHQANPGKPTKYFIDFENVHGAGLKGVDELGENDEVVIIYSQAAETFHIEQAIAILKSKAHIRFLEADAGTRNAADFQLIVALYGDMSDEFEYAIITGDGGFDAAIKMGERMGLPAVRRMANVCGDLEPEKPEKPKSRRSRRKRGGGEDATHDAAHDATAEEAAAQSREFDGNGSVQAANETELAAAELAGEKRDNQEPETRSSRTRRRRGGRSKSAGDDPAKRAEKAEEGSGEQASLPRDGEDAVDYAGVDAQSAQAPEAQASQSQSTQATEEQASQLGDEGQHERAEDEGRGKHPADDQVDQTAQQENASRRRPRRRRRSADPQDIQEEATEQVSEDAVVHAKIREALAKRDIQLEDAQIATLAQALEGVRGRQDFYRNIIKIERQQRGRALYHQVRDSYDDLRAIW